MAKSTSFKKSLSVYLISTLVEKGIGFLIVPLLTAFIDPQGIGKLSLLTSVIAFLFPLILLNSSGAVYVEYFKTKNRGTYKSYFSSALFINLILFGFFLLISLVGLKSFAKILDCPPQWIVAIPIFCLFDAIKTTVLSVQQIQKKPVVYGLISLSYSILNFCVSLLLVYSFNLDYQGRLLGMFTAGFAVFIIALFLFRKDDLLTSKISLPQIKDILAYGLPLLPHSFGYLVLDVSDRFFIKHFSGESALGIYSVAYLVSSAVYILASVFNNSFNPFLYESLHLNDEKSLLKITTTYVRFIVSMLVICVVYIFSVPLIYKLFIDVNYYSGIVYTPLIISGYFFMSIYLAFANIIFFYKKNRIFGIVAVFNIVFNIALNYILIAKLGPMGAAIATAISMFLFMLAIAIFSNRIIALPWRSAIKNAFIFNKA